MSKVLLKDSAIYSFGSILTKGLGFISAPLYAYYLPSSEYGIWFLVLAYTSFFGAFFNLGLDNAFSLFYFKKEINKTELVSTVLLFRGSYGFLLMLLAFAIMPLYENFIIEDEESNRSVFIIMIVVTYLQNMMAFLFSLFRNQFRPKLFVVLSLISAIVTLSINVVLLEYFKLGITSLAIGIAFASVMLLIIALILAKDNIKFTYSIELLKKLLKIGLPFVPASIVIWLYTGTDRMFLGKYSDSEEVAVYSIAVNVAAVITIFVNAFGRSFSPHALLKWEEDNEKAKIWLADIFEKLMIGFFFLIISCLVFTKFGLQVLFPLEYLGCWPWIYFLMLGLVAQTSTQISAAGISLNHKTQYVFYSTAYSAIINVGLNFLLVPHLGGLGAAIATFMAYLSLTVFYHLYSLKLDFIIPYKKKRIAIIMSIALCILSILFILDYFEQFALKLLFYVLLLVGFYRAVPNKEKEFYLQEIRNKLPF